MTQSLRLTTYNLLRNRPAYVKLGDIAEATGLPLGWLRSFEKHTIEGFAVDRVELLNNYLNGKPFTKIGGN